MFTSVKPEHKRSGVAGFDGFHEIIVKKPSGCFVYRHKTTVLFEANARLSGKTSD